MGWTTKNRPEVCPVCQRALTMCPQCYGEDHWSSGHYEEEVAGWVCQSEDCPEYESCCGC